MTRRLLSSTLPLSLLFFIPASRAFCEASPPPTPAKDVTKSETKGPASCSGAFTVVELEKETELTLKDISDPNVRIPLTLQECKDTGVTVTLESTPFVTANGDSIQPIFWDASAGARASVWPGEAVSDAAIKIPSITISRHETRLLVLAALLPIADSYHATVQLRANPSDVKRFVITVVRTKSQAQLEVIDPSPVSTSIRLHEVFKWKFIFHLYTKNRPLQLEAPVLLKATYRSKADAAAVALQPADGIRQDCLVGGFTVPPDTGASWSCALGGLIRPGRYDATFRFVSRGYPAVDGNVTAYVRRPGWWAFWSVCLGVVASLIIVYVISALIPRLRLRQRVAFLNRRLGSILRSAQGDAEAVELVTRVRDNIADSWTELRTGIPGGDALVGVYESVVPAVELWVRVHPRFKGDNDTEKKLRRIAEVLGARPPKAEEVSSAAKDLYDLNAKGPSQARVSAAVLRMIGKLGEPVPSPENNWMRIQLTMLLVSVAVCLVAGLSGVSTLWYDNLTWGSPGSLLAAFLSGFGLDIVAKTGLTKLWTPAQ